MARRTRVEHDAAAERVGNADRADDDAISGLGEQRPLQTRLPQLLPEVDQPRRARAGAVVHLDAASGGLVELERQVEAVGRLDRAVEAAEHVSGRDLLARDAGEVDRHPLSGGGALVWAIVNLHAPNTHDAASRQQPQALAAGDAARPQRSGDDRAGAPHAEDAIDVQHAGGWPRGAPRQPAGDSGQRGQELAQPLTGARRAGDRRDARQQPLDGPAGSRGVGEIRLRDRDYSGGDVERTQDAHVLDRLRHHAVVGCHGEHEHVYPAGAGNHRAHEALVAGHVDDR